MVVGRRRAAGRRVEGGRLMLDVYVMGSACRGSDARERLVAFLFEWIEDVESTRIFWKEDKLF